MIKDALKRLLDDDGGGDDFEAVARGALAVLFTNALLSSKGVGAGYPRDVATYAVEVTDALLAKLDAPVGP